MNNIVEMIANYSSPQNNSDFLDTVFGEYLRDVKDGNVPIVLFGVGAVGRVLCQVLQLHGVQPEYFCDNNQAEIGRCYHGVPVISFSDLKERCVKHLILIASNKYEIEMRQQLLEHGFQPDKLIPISHIGKPELLELGHYYRCEDYTKNPKHSLTLEDLQQQEDRLAAAYDLLADQKSKDLFIARLSFFTSKIDFFRFSNYINNFSELNESEREAFPFYVSPEDYGYFNNDVVHLKDGEVMVDGGAYNGLSAATFAKTCENKNISYKKIYSFEPDAGNFKLLKTNTANLHDVECIQKGLWSYATILTFLSASACDPGAVIASCSDKQLGANAIKTEIPTISIDEQFPDEGVTFIKMDVEGAEMEALDGAKNVIKRCQPTLAISAYHKHSDIFELPLLIHKLYPVYKFYLRHYSYTIFDMVLFAVPRAN